MPKDNITIGFVGLGTMGGRMATNIHKAGYKLVVHDLHRQAGEPSFQCRRHLGGYAASAGRAIRCDLLLAAGAGRRRGASRSGRMG